MSNPKSSLAFTLKDSLYLFNWPIKMWGAAKASSLTKSFLAVLVKCSSLDVLTSSSLLRWADIRLTSWSVLILSKTRLDSFRVWKKCQRSEKGQSTKVENELYKSALVTRRPALTPGCHTLKPPVHPEVPHVVGSVFWECSVRHT